ncbi:hypothetical protein GCM10018980_67340 [Streptomyces capoamus]|uniref:Uncharacterized protein n=1 Tax=Streptomyces capoamus TaxID=68183 RepID=A0A919KFI2_9ACTN|nr:hypothetical protein GCM10010501_73110 [Streptomyces libani subsp. rufus]GHG71744.1 hypothetical protein GCM10018980_67340 [Streptomyces capoamus]
MRHLTHARGAGVRVRPGRCARNPRGALENALNRGNVETTKVIETDRAVTGAYPQFGPVVDLAYTRRRATW